VIMNDHLGSGAFDEYYFAHGCGRPYKRDEEWLSFFAGIAKRIVTDIEPRSVLDAGCAMGFLVEELRNLGVEAYGVDVSEYAIENVHASIKDYCWQGSIADPFPQSYDLIVCIEVLEHMDPKHGEDAIANLCKHTDDILFSSTPFDFKEATHYNVRPPEYWSQLFAKQGFFRDVDFDATFIVNWAARYRRKDEPLHRHVRNYERKYWQLWKENQDLRELVGDMRDALVSMERQLKKLERERDQEQLVDSVSNDGVSSPPTLAGQPRVGDERPKESMGMNSPPGESEEVSDQMRQRGRIQELERALEVWEKRWAQLNASPGGRLLRSLRNLRIAIAPAGSRRHALLQRILKRG